MSLARLLAAALIAAQPVIAPATPTEAAATARAVTREVDGALDRLDRAEFVARRPGVDYDSRVVAWRDATGVRKVEAIDLDDSGSVVGTYYFRSGALVFAYIATKGWQGEREVTRHERRQYFQDGALVRWLDGMEKAERLPDDPDFAPEARERLAAAAFYRDEARRAFARDDVAGAPADPAKHGATRPAAPTEADTVTIGGDTRPATATVVALVNGDTACMVELRDAVGRTHHEAADFDVCFQQPGLVGRRVALEWTLANVQAASCGGDPECGDSERIALIASARILDDAGAAAPASLCAAGETIVFACRTVAKQVSVCAARDATATTGYAQYRFGAPGAIELDWPATRIPAAQAATADNIPFSGGGASWMRFRRGDHAYVVYSGIGRWGPNGETQTRAGVVVERGDRTIAHLPCDGGDAAGELGPAWFEQVGLAPNGEVFDLPE